MTIRGIALRCSAAALFGLALAAGSCSKSGDSGPASPPTGSTATVTGIVIGTGGSGLPIPGAQIGSSPSAAAAVTSNSFGFFSLKVPANTAVSVTARLAGYAPHPTSLNLASGETRALVMAIAPVGASQSVSTGPGGKVTDPLTKTAVTLPPGFVTGTSNAQVTVTGIDPTQPSVLAMPGSFAASTVLGSPTTLEPFAIAQVEVGDGAGLPFPLAQPVEIELHLPDALATDPRILSGQPVPCLRYNALAGEWQAFGTGAIVSSSVDGKPAVKFSVNSLSWFATGYLNGSNSCASGTVTISGAPVANAFVQAYPGGSAVTGGNGAYQVPIPAGATARIVAARPATGTVGVATATVTGGSIGAGCTTANLALGGGPQPSTFTVEAEISRGRDFIGVPRDAATVRIFSMGGAPAPLSGATVTLGNGVDGWLLPLRSPGVYGLVAGSPDPFALDEGTTYTLDVDLEPDGVVDGSASVLMPARPTITAPLADEVVGGSFTATWLDPLTGTPGYSVRYIGSMESASFGTFPAIFALQSPAGSAAIGTGVGQPQYSMPNDPLITGQYTFRLWATNGPVRYPVGNTVQFAQANISTPRILGWFSAVAKADSVRFNSLGDGGPGPAAQREARGGRRTAATGTGAYLRRR